MLVLLVQQRLVTDFYKILNQVNTQEIPDGLKLPDSFSQLVAEMKNKQYDARTFAFMLRAMVCFVLYIDINVSVCFLRGVLFGRLKVFLKWNKSNLLIFKFLHGTINITFYVSCFETV